MKKRSVPTILASLVILLLTVALCRAEAASGDTYAGQVRQFLAALKSGDDESCNAVLAKFAKVRFIPGSVNDLTNADEELILSAAGSEKPSVRACARKLIVIEGGYRGITVLLQMLHDGSVSEVLDAAYWLQAHTGDPRIGPALLGTFNRFVAARDYRNAAGMAYYIGTIGYRPAGPALRGLAISLAQGEWWLDDMKRSVLPRLFSALGEIGDKEAAPLYNKLLAEASPVLFRVAKTPEESSTTWPPPLYDTPAVSADGTLRVDLRGLPEMLFIAGADVADADTLKLFVEFLRGPESTLVGWTGSELGPYYSDGSLHKCAQVVLLFALPWSRDWSVDDYAKFVAATPDLDAAYVDMLRKDMSVGHDADSRVSVSDVLRILSRRKITSARPDAEAFLENRADTLVIRDASFVAQLGSWKAMAVLLSAAQDKEMPTDHARNRLQTTTGNYFGRDYALWQWWLKEAEQRLHWDVDTSSLQPAEAWERLAQEALQKQKSRSGSEAAQKAQAQ